MKHVLAPFMFGPDRLVAPVLEKSMEERSVILPEGRWENDEGAT